ncbi:hypothetical protein SCLCIDRAFT_1207101 [Scleroderma citrinum Foug A]|uniref:Uncharacterized protein n=1 Tax=Scleroderma citrinum Foug A TaxID=1036808 RepID=A0A0C3AAU7_9AGAM|nr:hypothetical protein SCLCIDRAFT_1207101 [Scleroderma citrinum Foug A]
MHRVSSMRSVHCARVNEWPICWTRLVSVRKMNSASGVYVQLATSPVYLHMRNEGGLRSVETREKQLSPIERLPLLCHAKRNVGGYGARHYQGDLWYSKYPYAFV